LEVIIWVQQQTKGSRSIEARGEETGETEEPRRERKRDRKERTREREKERETGVTEEPRRERKRDRKERTRERERKREKERETGVTEEPRRERKRDRKERKRERSLSAPFLPTHHGCGGQPSSRYLLHRLRMQRAICSTFGRLSLRRRRIRGRLYVSESAYKSLYDSVHNLYTNRIWIQFFI
jgi:hypothetical protein